MLEIFENVFAPKKKDNTGLIIGIAAGALAAAAATYVTARVVKEVKGDLKEVYFVSPDEENVVSVTSGSSETARGLTLIKVKAYKKSGGDECKFSFLSRKGELYCKWHDNDSFELLSGKGERKQCCEADFGGEEITLKYYFKKITNEEEEGEEE